MWEHLKSRHPSDLSLQEYPLDLYHLENMDSKQDSSSVGWTQFRPNYSDQATTLFKSVRTALVCLLS